MTDEYIPEPSRHFPNHPGRVMTVVDRERSRSNHYIYKHVVTLHDRIDVEGLPSDIDGWHKLLNRTAQEFERAGMPEPRISVDLEIESDYGDQKPTGVLHFASMRDATPEEAQSYDDWKAQQERLDLASRKAALQAQLRDLEKRR